MSTWTVFAPRKLSSKLIIRTEIPGVDEKDIDLKVDGRTLTIKGERRPEVHPRKIQVNA